LRYLDAAQRFAEAAAKVPQGHDDERWKYLNEEAAALYRQGDEFGDNAAALSTIDRCRHLAELRPRNAFPRDWAKTQMELGVALETLGERERGTARFEEAVAAYRDALQEQTRARVPLEWAMTQVNLGNALLRLGERESGTARLEEAVSAYREALQEYTRARVSLDWAMTQFNLALAYRALCDKDHQPLLDRLRQIPAPPARPAYTCHVGRSPRTPSVGRRDSIRRLYFDRGLV
jgi:tetratricopeptide (TPR) repeat protein